MKLSPEQLAEKKARDNIKRLKNRVSSEFAFKKWRDYHSYLHSMGYDDEFIRTQANVDLNRQQLDELLNKYEDEAIRNISKPDPAVLQSGDSVLPVSRSSDTTKTNVSEESLSDKMGANNNYGLSKSEKERVSLFWFQKLAASNLLKGFGI